MAVLTAITTDEVQRLLEGYDLGALSSVEGIAAGSVNSNFALIAGGRRVFLRVYEEQSRSGAERETATLERLAAAGVPTPPPFRRRDGGFVSDVRGKPAALFPWRDGAMRCQASVTADDTRRLGEALARTHLAGMNEPCDAGRFRFEDLSARLDRIAASGGARFADVGRELRVALSSAHAARDPGLPRGLIHGDLFRDNVLWTEGGELAALLDFESISEGTFAYDLMVVVLAWCVGDDLDPLLARALYEGYARVRPLTEAERRSLAAEGMFASLRFAITRITDFAMRAEAEGPRAMKDWNRFTMRFEKLHAMGPQGVRDLLGC